MPTASVSSSQGNIGRKELKRERTVPAGSREESILLKHVVSKEVLHYHHLPPSSLGN